MAGLPSRVFKTLAEFEGEAERATKEALLMTLNHFKSRLREIAVTHIYNNVYKRKWYQRTNWLTEDDAIEAYVYKNVKNAIGGGVRFNREAYDDFSKPFQHGNPTRYLPMNSYLEIMCDSSLLPKGDKNVFNFPTNEEIDRGNFYEEFLKELDEDFYSKFDEMWNRAINRGKTGKIDLRGITGRNTTTSSVGAKSSSTSQYKSIGSSNVNY